MEVKNIKILHVISFYLLEDVFFKCHQSLLKSIQFAKYNNRKNKIMIIINSKLSNKKFYELNPINIIVEKNKNLGFTGSANFAFQYALKHKYDAVNLINQDIIFPKKTIPSLLKEFSSYKNKKNIGILSPLQLNQDSELDHKMQTNLKNIIKKNQQIQNNFLKVDFVNAACWLINIELIKLLGSMNYLLDHFGSDDDYVRRMGYTKFNLFLLPKIKVYHLRSFYNKKNEMHFYNIKQIISGIQSYIFLNILKKKKYFSYFFYCASESGKIFFSR
jgi:GT2 family glycosyltransferase